MKYLAIVMVLCMVGVGCKMVEPSVKTVQAEDGTKFYCIKSGTSEGGGPVVTSTVGRDSDDHLFNVASFSGDSTGALITKGLAGVPAAAVNNIGAAAVIRSGMKHLGDDYNTTNNNTTTGSKAASGSIAKSSSKSSSKSGAYAKGGSANQYQQSYNYNKSGS